MKIQVTQDHIDKGIRGKGCLCPIALAFKSCYGENIQVNYDHVYIGWHSYELPSNVKRFIRNFDMEYPVMPFEFEFIG